MAVVDVTHLPGARHGSGRGRRRRDARSCGVLRGRQQPAQPVARAARPVLSARPRPRRGRCRPARAAGGGAACRRPASGEVLDRHGQRAPAATRRRGQRRRGVPTFRVHPARARCGQPATPASDAPRARRAQPSTTVTSTTGEVGGGRALACSGAQPLRRAHGPRLRRRGPAPFVLGRAEHRLRVRTGGAAGLFGDLGHDCRHCRRRAGSRTCRGAAPAALVDGAATSSPS